MRDVNPRNGGARSVRDSYRPSVAGCRAGDSPIGAASGVASCAAHTRGCVGLLREQRVRERGLALVETFGVERLFELEELVVEMMADFVYDGAQERLEGDDLPPG